MMHEFVLLIITNAVFGPTLYFLSPTIHKRVTHAAIGNFIAISQYVALVLVIVCFYHI